MLQAERNRLGQVFGRGQRPVAKSLKAHIAYLERELRGADADLGAMIRESPVWREKDDLLRSVPGVGARSVADAARRAPGARAPGRPGRPGECARGLYMATLVASRRNPAIAAFYRRLVGRGTQATRARGVHAEAAHDAQRDGAERGGMAQRPGSR